MPANLQMLESLFRQRGAMTARELRQALRVSQPTVSRSLARMGRSVIRLGRGPSTRYAMVREIGSHGSSWPIYEMGVDGRPSLAGTLRSLQSRQWVFEQEEAWDALRGEQFARGLYPDWPWFLDDLRPQGFLGGVFARAHAKDLGIGFDPRNWSADNVLEAMLRYGHDLPGAFVIGEQMLREAQERRLVTPPCIGEADRAEAYARLATETLAGEWPGSSAAGEQPKFTARVWRDGDPVSIIVKFSGSAGRPEDVRWADLLAAEHIAASLLNERGIPSARTALLQGGGRTFLESTRFDRVHVHERRNVVSLGALDAAFYGDAMTPWTQISLKLQADGWITAEDAQRMALLWWFGTLIGNTDMHYGNVSFFLTPDRPLQLAPTYDMLPMLYRPDVEGALPDRPFNPHPPLPEAMGVWSRAIEMAIAYWGRVAEAASVSEGFRGIAGRNQETLVGHVREFG